MQAQFRAGLVGAGYVSDYHVAAIRRLKGRVELVGLCDVVSERAEAAARKHGTKALASMEDLVRAGANVIHVLTPPATHAQVALEALNLGCHVLVEKPLAEDIEDCFTIQHKASEKGLNVCVNHSLLFDPQVRKALAAVRSGRIGKVVSVDILRSSSYPPYPGGPLPPQYRTAGYPFRDLGVHALYLFEALLGPIESVNANWASLGGDPNLAFDEWRAMVRCRDGLGQFQLSWNVKPPQSQIIIHGTKGVLRVDLFLMFQARRSLTRLPKAAERVMNALTDSAKPLWDVPLNVLGFLRGKVLPFHGLQDLVREFYGALEAGSAMPVGINEAVGVVRWVEKIAHAADEDHQRRVSNLSLSEQVPVLVTGASGGLGSSIVDRLRAKGDRVRVFVRRAPKDVPKGVEVALGDLGDPSAVDRAVRGAQTVIHAGAAMSGGWPDHQRGTVTGTHNVLDACLKHQVKKLVHISSLSVVDWASDTDHGIISEESEQEPFPLRRGHYTRAKLEAERLVSQYAVQQQLPAVILRPGQIFGGRIPLLTAAIARKRGKRWIVLGDGNNPLPLVYVDDVVDAILTAAQGGLHNGEIIQLVDSQVLTQNQVLRMCLSDDASIVRLPSALIFALGATSELMLGALRRQSPVSRYRLRSALSRHRFISKNADLLVWAPKIGVVNGIRLTQVRDEVSHAQTDASATAARVRPDVSSARRSPAPTELALSSI